MRLHEFEAMDIFETMGIPVPRRRIAESIEEALMVAGKIGYPVIIKAQVLVGGRGLAGGLKIASSPEELGEIVETLFSSEIKGLYVQKILIAEKAEITFEDQTTPSGPDGTN